MDQLRFDIPEILALIGLSQCVYVLVYMMFRSGDAKRAAIPAIYFLVLGLAFFLDFGQNYIGSHLAHYGEWRWAAWFSGPPLAALLAVQIARISKMPALSDYWVLLLPPLAFATARIAAQGVDECTMLPECGGYYAWLVVTGLVAGALSLLNIWINRGMMAGLHTEKSGKERYWLILMLVFVNLFFLAVMFSSLTPFISIENARLVRICLGLALGYLAGTSLFRIYPQSVVIVDRRASREMSDTEVELAKKIETMIDLEKVYHEPGYNRADLARELKVPESVVSRVINVHFGRSLPQILNERRVGDAKRMLKETDATIKVIATEVGFNSMASFNRIFREQTGMTPSDFRGSDLDENIA